MIFLNKVAKYHLVKMTFCAVMYMYSYVCISELERKRRIPYFYPRYNYGYLKRLDDENDDKSKD